MFSFQAVQVNTELRSATATLNIWVLDINDNLPKFVTEPHEVKITEHSHIGSRVTQVSAVDKDQVFIEKICLNTNRNIVSVIYCCHFMV